MEMTRSDLNSAWLGVHLAETHRSPTLASPGDGIHLLLEHPLNGDDVGVAVTTIKQYNQAAAKLIPMFELGESNQKN